MAVMGFGGVPLYGDVACEHAAIGACLFQLQNLGFTVVLNVQLDLDGLLQGVVEVLIRVGDADEEGLLMAELIGHLQGNRGVGNEYALGIRQFRGGRGDVVAICISI